MNTEDIHRNMIAFGEWILNSTFMNKWANNKMWWWDSAKLGKERDITYTTEELFQIS